MVLASPGPLLTPPPSSSPPKTPHRSYSTQTRSQDAEKNPSPKPYLPPQTRTRHRRAHRPHVSTLMRGNTPPTTRSPPHQSRLTGNPPNLQPVTVIEEELDGRDQESRLTLMRVAPDCRPPPTTQHASQPRSRSTSHPPQQQDTVRQPHRCSPSQHVPCQQQQARGKEDPVVSNRPLHSVMQQRCHHASASARSPSWPPMPRPRLQRAATDRREKVQLLIGIASFFAQ
jgi:hypothetical protein